MRELHVDTEAVWEERRELLDDIRGIAARLEELTGVAAARFPSREPAERAEEGLLEPERLLKLSRPGRSDGYEAAGDMSMVGSRERSDQAPASTRSRARRGAG